MSRLIDADRLLEEHRMNTYYHLPNGDTAVPIIDIQHAPTIEPERKTGEWIIDENAVLPFGSGDCRCSVCGGGCESYWNYCPHCGSLNGKVEGE